MAKSSGNLEVQNYRVLGIDDPTCVTDDLTIPQSGWIKQVQVYARGYGSPARGRVVVYGNDDKLIFKSPEQSWDINRGWKFGEPAAPVRLRADRPVKVGFWHNPVNDVEIGLASNDGTFHTYDYREQDDAPDVWQSTMWSGTLAAAITFAHNQAPSKGVWMSPTPEGLETDPNPTFVGTIPHPEGSDMGEYSIRVQVRISRGDGVVVRNNVYDVRDAENAQGYFTRKIHIGDLETGRNYHAEFRHADSWGVWSDWSNLRTFQREKGPLTPKIIRPVGKLDYTHEADAPFTYMYRGTYDNPEGSALAEVEYEIWTEDMAARIIYRPWRPPDHSPLDSTDWLMSQDHSAFNWGVKRIVRARVRDALGRESPWGSANFNTNAAPDIPSQLDPQNGTITNTAILSCRVVDPDGDDIQSVTFDLVNADTGASITGYPKVVSGPFESGSTVELNISADVTLGTNLRWKVRAADHVLQGDNSDWQTFRYDSVPTVRLLAPDTQAVTNKIKHPSAEYDPASVGAYWVESGGDLNNFVRRVQDTDDPYIGDWSWEMVSDGTVVHRIASGKEAVDTTRPAFLSVGMKKDTGTGSHSLRVDCYDATNVLLGSVYPSDPWGLLQNTDPNIIWKRYGGYIAPATWPVGTVSAAVVIERSTLSAAPSTVRFDGFLFAQVTAETTAADAPWFGFFSGDTVPHDALEGYSWAGTPGNSESRGLNRLTSPTADLSIFYSSDTAALKAADRKIVEQWTGTEWKRIHSGKWVPGTRTRIPIPTSKLKNQGRYRVRIEAKDANNIVGVTNWVEIDVDYEGPPQLPITVIDADNDAATIRVEWTASGLTVDELEEIQVAVTPADGDRAIISRIRDPQATQETFHFPRSDIQYLIEVRQVQATDGGPVEGRWASESAQVFYRNWHIKAVDAPDTDAVSFVPYSEMDASDEVEADITEIREWGQALPSHYISLYRPEKGQLPIQIFKHDPLKHSKLAMLKRLVGRTVCILTSGPNEKRFAMLTAAPRQLGQLPLYATYTVSWEETNYSEDQMDPDNG